MFANGCSLYFVMVPMTASILPQSVKIGNFINALGFCSCSGAGVGVFSCSAMAVTERIDNRIAVNNVLIMTHTS